MSSTTPIKNTAAIIDGYGRVSDTTGRKGRESYGTKDDQRKTIEGLVGPSPYTLGEVVIEEDVKGDTPTADRELERLVAKVEAGQSAGIVVHDVTRFSRNYWNGIDTIRRVMNAGGVFMSPQVNTATPFGRSIAGLLLEAGEQEHDRKKAVRAETKRRAIARGAWVGRAPFGYTKDGEGRLVVEPVTASLVRQAFEMRLGGASLYAIVDMLNEAHPGGPSGKGTPWNRSTIKKALGRTMYHGHVKYGEHERRDEALAIVTEADFIAVQRINEKRGEGKARRGRGPVSLLAGSLVCKGCGGPMNRKSGGTKNNAKGYATYTCTAKERDRSCSSPATAMERKLDALVESLAFPEFSGPFESFIYSETVPGPALVNVNTPEVEALVAELDAARTSRASFNDPAIRDALGTDGFLAGLATADERVAEVEARLDAVLADRIEPDAGPTPVIESEWRAMNLEERREELGRRISRVVVTRTEPRVKGEPWQPLAERVSVEWVGGVAPAESVPARAIRAA